MKTIVILHSKDSRNYGSFMMTINATQYLHSKYPSASFYIEMDTPNDTERLNQELNQSVRFTPIDSVPLYHSDSKGVKDIKRLLGYQKQSSLVQKLHPDLVVYLGGDDFSEYYNKHKVMVELFWAWRFSQKTKVVFLGHTMGPFTSYRKSLVSRFLSQSTIVTRDQKSYDHLTNDLAIPHNVHTSHDLAFLNLPRQENQEILTRYKLVSDSYITCVPSALYSHYAGSMEDYLKGWISIIKTLLHQQNLKDTSILLFAHVIHDAKIDDRTMIKKILEVLTADPEVDMSRIKNITDILLASEARAILGNGILTVSGRMHATVSTFQMGKPAIPLSYSVKYAGVIGQSLQQADLIIEAKNAELWSSLQIAEEVNQKINLIFSDYNQRRETISKRVSVIQSELTECMDTILLP